MLSQVPEGVLIFSDFQMYRIFIHSITDFKLDCILFRVYDQSDTDTLKFLWNLPFWPKRWPVFICTVCALKEHGFQTTTPESTYQATSPHGGCLMVLMTILWSWIFRIIFFLSIQSSSSRRMFPHCPHLCPRSFLIHPYSEGGTLWGLALCALYLLSPESHRAS